MDVIPSYSALRKFKRHLVLHLVRKGDDLVHGTFVQLAKHYCDVLGVDMDTVRIDSFLLDINAPALSRLQLIYVCTERFVSALAKEGIEVAEQVKHFLDPGDYNYVTYHDTDTPEETKMERLLADASFVMDTMHRATKSSMSTASLTAACTSRPSSMKTGSVSSVRRVIPS